jgi:hypothetical protein
MNKYITSFIFLLLILACGWFFLVLVYVEEVFPFYPLIETKLPSGFSQAKFERIQVGMTKTEVLKFLPPPITGIGYNTITKSEYKGEWSINHNAWYYGEESPVLWGDFAWFKFEIHFDKEGKVARKDYEIYYD